MIRTEFTYPSAWKGQEVFGRIWQRNSDYIGVVQLVHGMQEHMERYDRFAVFLAERGFVVYGNDHLGHGRSVKKETDFGYFGPEEGWKNLLADMRILMERAKKEHPGLPFILIGHSMGSLLAREFAAEYGDELDMAVFLGTSGGSPLVKAAKKLAEKRGARMGIKTPARDLGRMAFGAYNRKFRPKRTNHDWLSTLDGAVNDFIMDPLCGREFTYGGYRDLFAVLEQVSAKEWPYRVPKNLPMLLMSGKDDPVGDYGRGVRHVARSLLRADCRKVSLRLYAGMRHELLQESREREVCEDLVRWIYKNLKEKAGSF